MRGLPSPTDVRTDADLDRDPPARPPLPARRRMPVLLILVGLLAVAVAAMLPMRPPAPAPVSAPANSFSADRALALLGGIASVPHPTGSPAQAAVRGRLLDGFRALGLTPAEQSRVAVRAEPGRPTAVARVTNLHVRIPGSGPTGRVLLVAHYDSVPTGPGAGDNGVNVASVLEIARVLTAGPQPRNDIDLLLTDGEEQGLLGAQAFVDSGAAGDPARVVAVNLEARGVSGPAVMFQQAGTGLAGAVRAADPVTTSAADEIYRLLPNDTDLTVLGQAGMRGLNFAFVGGGVDYHTTQDNPGRVSHRSVQDMGDAALAATRHLAAADLRAGGPPATYFSLFGAVVAYSGWLVLPLAGLAFAGLIALLWRGRRRGLSPRAVGWPALTFPLVLLGAAATGLGGWWALSLVRPDFVLAEGFVHRAGPYALAQLALVLVVVAGWYRLARRHASGAEVLAGVLGWLSALAVLCAVLIPGAAYLVTWPALTGVAALLVAVHRGRPGSPMTALAGCAATAAPALALLLPLALLLEPTLGLSLTAGPLLISALIAATLVGLLGLGPAKRRLTAAMLTVTVTAVVAGGIVATVDGPGAGDPQSVSLGYLLQADTGSALWISRGSSDQPTVGRLLTGGSAALGTTNPVWSGASLTTGPAPVATGLGLARCEVVSAGERDGVRSVRVRIHLPTGAYAAEVYAGTAHHEILDATVDGVPLPGGRPLPAAEGGWTWGFRYAGVAPDGMDVLIRARGEGPLTLRVVSTSAGLPSGAPALPGHLTWTRWPTIAGQTFVAQTFPA